MIVILRVIIWVCTESVQPCAMKTRRFIEDNTRNIVHKDKDASFPFKVYTLGPLTVLPVSLATAAWCSCSSGSRSHRINFAMTQFMPVSCIKILDKGPGWCGSVWALDCEAKGCQFNSQLGHVLGLWAGSPVWGAREATTHWCFSPSLLFPL